MFPEIYQIRAYQVGTKKDEIGYGVYSICKDYSALIVTGHSHNYARSHTIEEMATQAVAERCERTDCIYNLTDVSMVSPFTAYYSLDQVVVSGLGGRAIVEEDVELSSSNHWASTFDDTFGVMYCKFNFNGNNDLTYCYFKDIAGNEQDTFYLYRGAPADFPSL